MPGWSTLLNIASKAAGFEGATAASLKSAAKQVAIEKIKSAAANAPRAIFNAAGGDRVPLLRHGADILGSFRKASTEGDSPEDKQEKLKARQESKTERAQAKRERDEDDNEKRQEKAEREAAKHDADVSTSTLQLIARDVSDIKEYILSPKKVEEKKDGIFGKILSGILSIAALIPGIVVAIRSAMASMINAIRGLITGLGRGAATAEAAGGAAKATEAAGGAAKATEAAGGAAKATEAAGGAAKIVPATRGAALMTRVAGLANKIPGAKLLGRVAAPLGIGLAGVDMAQNGVGVGNSMDMAANAMLMAPSPHTKALGGGMLAGRFLGDMLGINDEENEAKANLKKAQAALARQEESNAKRLADRKRSTIAPAPVGVGDGGSLTKQTPAAVPKLTAPKLPAPAPLAPGSDMAGKSAVQLLSDLVKAATTPDEGIYIRNGVKTIQPKESTNQGAKPAQPTNTNQGAKPAASNAKGGAQSTEGAKPAASNAKGGAQPTEPAKPSQPTKNTNQGAKPAASNAKGEAQPTEAAPKSSLSVPTNRVEYTETEKAVMARAENAGKKAGIEPVDLPDSHPLNAALPTLTGTNPSAKGTASQGAFRFGGGHDEAIAEAAQKIGIREDTLRGMIKQEGGTTGKVSPTGYYGSGQFRKAAWDTVANSKEGREAGIRPLSAEQDKLTATYRGKTLPSDIAARDPRSDPRQSALATAIYAKLNAKALGKPLSQMSGEEIYLAHNMGVGGLKKLKAGNASQRDILANTGGRAMSSHEFLAWQSANFNRNAEKANRGWSFDSDGTRKDTGSVAASKSTVSGASEPERSAIPPMLRAPPAQQGEAVYTANKKAEAKASAPIVVQGGPTIVQGGGGKSRNSSRGGGGAQTTMVTRNPDPAIRATILGWLQRMV